MPYRIDIAAAAPDAFDVLAESGALDIEQVGQGFAAILPDSVAPAAISDALGGISVQASSAVSRDSGSVWLLNPPPIRIGSIVIASPGIAAPDTALRLVDSPAFGTGYHPTTALCLEWLEEILLVGSPGSLLDVGTGSGVVALAALLLGIPQALGLDVDPAALRTAMENARLNNLQHRLQLRLGSPEVATGNWPLVVANILAAPLIDMAPVLVRRLASGGRLLLSGIADALASEVSQAYQHFGVRLIDSKSRAGWTALVFQSSW